MGICSKIYGILCMRIVRTKGRKGGFNCILMVQAGANSFTRSLTDEGFRVATPENSHYIVATKWCQRARVWPKPSNSSAGCSIRIRNGSERHGKHPERHVKPDGTHLLDALHPGPNLGPVFPTRRGGVMEQCSGEIEFSVRTIKRTTGSRHRGIRYSHTHWCTV